MTIEKVNTIIIYLLLAIAIVLSNIQEISNLNIVVFIIISVILYKNTKEKRNIAKIEKVKVVTIIVFVYYIIYVILGLIVGYKNSPYSLKTVEIIKNIINIVLIQVLYEYTRGKLISRSRKIENYIIITAIFLLLRLELFEFTNLVSLEDVLTYFMQKVLPVTIQSILLTFLAVNGGTILNTIYILIVELFNIILPIFPDIDWFIEISTKYIMYLLIFLFVVYEDSVRTRRKPKKQLKREKPIRTIPYIIIAILLVSFVAGILPYRPVAIISNSMQPTFSRGDICIVQRINDYEQIKQINKGDIIEYYLNEIFILHRVTEVHKKSNGIEFITKGDSNSIQDLLPVSEEQVIGVVVYTIPYLGYPSVWLSEILKKNN